MSKRNKDGVILFIVMAVIIVVSVLATAMLSIIANQSRLTHHQVSRIQAQYAAKAGVIYAMDKLRRNDNPTCWPNTGTYTIYMRRTAGAACDIVETSLPVSIQDVAITVDVPGSGISGTRQISAIATYTPI